MDSKLKKAILEKLDNKIDNFPIPNLIAFAKDELYKNIRKLNDNDLIKVFEREIDDKKAIRILYGDLHENLRKTAE